MEDAPPFKLGGSQYDQVRDVLTVFFCYGIDKSIVVAVIRGLRIVRNAVCTFVFFSFLAHLQQYLLQHPSVLGNFNSNVIKTPSFV